MGTTLESSHEEDIRAIIERDYTPSNITGLDDISSFNSIGEKDIPDGLVLPRDVKKREKGILHEAEETTRKTRQGKYGHPIINFTRTAVLWTVELKTVVMPEQVASCMIHVKQAREVHSQQRDNNLDTAGYADTRQRVHDWFKENPEAPRDNPLSLLLWLEKHPKTWE